YLGVMGFFVLWAIAGFLTQDMEYDFLASILDPFGTRPVAIATRYWSANERNTLFPAPTGYLLLNRVLWLGIATVMLVAAFNLFRPQRFRGSKRWVRRHTPAAPVEQAVAPARSSARPQASFGASALAAQFLHQLRFDTVGVLKSVPFLVLL